jgi:YD repeat-containing protein
VEHVTHIDGSKEIFDYDLSNQLKYKKHVNASGTVTLEISYQYDVLGNRKSMTKESTTTSYSHDKANQMTAIDGTVLSYDANGKITNNRSNAYQYNAENQLTSVVNSAGTTIAIYEYNHEGQRTKKVSGGQTKMYYYNAGDVAYITDGVNEVRYSFTRDAFGNPINASGTATTGDGKLLRTENPFRYASYFYARKLVS